MRIESVITAFCDMLRANIEAEVILGRPDDTLPGVYVWPWSIDENSSLRDILKPVGPSSSLEHHDPGVILNFLVFVMPALTIEGLSTLGETRQTILCNPILNVDDITAKVILNPLSSDHLAALFLAADIPLEICLSVRLDGRNEQVLG